MIKLLKILFSIETDFTFNEGTQQRGLELMLEDGTNRCIMVAELNQQIVGMCSAQILISTAEGGIVALVEDLVVEDACRGKGIGKKLLLAIEGWASERGVRRLQLLADRNNAPGLEFYKKMNWKRTEMIGLRTCVTQRSVHTTQSKLTVQAPCLGSGVPGQKRRPCRMAGSARPLAKDGRVSLEPRMAGGDLVRCPASGVGSLNGSLLVCLRKDVALV